MSFVSSAVQVVRHPIASYQAARDWTCATVKSPKFIGGSALAVGLGCAGVYTAGIDAVLSAAGQFSRDSYSVRITGSTVSEAGKNLITTTLINDGSKIETRVFANEDANFNFKWNSNDITATAQSAYYSSAVCLVDTTGFRIPWLSRHENIIAIACELAEGDDLKTPTLLPIPAPTQPQLKPRFILPPRG